jgi:hypothetical protein
VSFTNTDLVQNVEFSAGGFQAKFGDIFCIGYYLSETCTVGDIREVFFLGSLSIDAVSKNKKWTAITGVRYRNNSLLVNSQDTNFAFVDVQTNVNYHFVKWNGF